MDESLEVFATDGRPLGELLHDPFSDAVTWEIAPGRTDVAPAAGPDRRPRRRPPPGRLDRRRPGRGRRRRPQGTPDRAETESALSAMLRAIDTTLWTVDPFGSLGTEHIAGLVGRPIAVVTARLSLDVQSDVDDSRVPDDGAAHRTAGRLRRRWPQLACRGAPRRDHPLRRRPARLLRRRRLLALPRGRPSHRRPRRCPAGAGRACSIRTAPTPPSPCRSTHPYIDTDGVLRIHPGQTVRLTLLMHPGGKVHLIVGHPAAQQSRRWRATGWHPGLSVLAPSLRCGPLLIDADKVRLPKVASFPAEQLFTRRDTPTSWKDDPILAATQSALLPDTRRRCRRAGSGSRRTSGGEGGLMARYDWPAPPRGEDDPMRARAARLSPAPDGRPDDDRTAPAAGAPAADGRGRAARRRAGRQPEPVVPDRARR